MATSDGARLVPSNIVSLAYQWSYGIFTGSYRRVREEIEIPANSNSTGTYIQGSQCKVQEMLPRGSVSLVDVEDCCRALGSCRRPSLKVKTRRTCVWYAHQEAKKASHNSDPLHTPSSNQTTATRLVNG